MPRHASIRPQGHTGKQYPIGDSDSNYCLRDPGNYTWDLAASYITLAVIIDILFVYIMRIYCVLKNNSVDKRMTNISLK